MDANSTSYHPDWLGRRLLDDDFAWDEALTIPLSKFFEHYTLHDSVWIALYLTVNDLGVAIAVIRFDAFWTEGRVLHPGSKIAEWPILLLRFSELSSVQLNGFVEPNWSSRTIDSAETEALLAPLQVITTIADVYGGRMSITHHPLVRILCLNRAGEALPLPWNEPRA